MPPSAWADDGRRDAADPTLSLAMPAPRRGATGGGASGRQSFVPLGQVADIKVVGGPPMVRDEAGLLVGYVYVDIDQAQRDIGGYVNEAKEVVADGDGERRAQAAGRLLPQVDRPVRAARARCWRA